MTTTPTDDVFVDGLSARGIEEKALAWRETFGVGACWQPDLLRIVEFTLPKMFPDFSLVIRPDPEMIGFDGYTQFTPPQIALPDSGYSKLQRGDHRARWTVAHELGHLLLHEAISKPRSSLTNRSRAVTKIYNSAEWQANKFAEQFLLPEHVISEFTSAREISANCNVSLQAAEIRFRQIVRDPSTHSSVW